MQTVADDYLEAQARLQFIVDEADSLTQDISLHLCDSLRICKFSKDTGALKRIKITSIASVAGGADLQETYKAPHTFKYYDSLLVDIKKTKNTANKYADTIKNTDWKVVEREINSAPKPTATPSKKKKQKESIKSLSNSHKSNKKKRRLKDKKRRKKRKRSALTESDSDASETQETNADPASLHSDLPTIFETLMLSSDPPPPISASPSITPIATTTANDCNTAAALDAPSAVDADPWSDVTLSFASEIKYDRAALIRDPNNSPLFISVLFNDYLMAHLCIFPSSYKDTAAARRASKIFHEGFKYTALATITRIHPVIKRVSLKSPNTNPGRYEYIHSKKYYQFSGGKKKYNGICFAHSSWITY